MFSEFKQSFLIIHKYVSDDFLFMLMINSFNQSVELKSLNDYPEL